MADRQIRSRMRPRAHKTRGRPMLKIFLISAARKR